MITLQRDALRKVVHASKRATLMLTKRDSPRNTATLSTKTGMPSSLSSGKNKSTNAATTTTTTKSSIQPSDDAVVAESALWFVCKTEADDQYYYNPTRDETSWDLPANVDASLLQAWDEPNDDDEAVRVGADDDYDDDDDDAALTAEMDALECKHLLLNGGELICVAGNAPGEGVRVFVWAPEELDSLRWRPVGTPPPGSAVPKACNDCAHIVG
jgi:hypothetical protein